MLVSNYPNVSINTANPPTEMARRDAVRRDLFEPVKSAEKTGAEKPVVSDEKARVAGSNNSTVSLYDANGKETETQQAIDGRGEGRSDEQQGNASDRDSDDSTQQDAKQQDAKQKQVEQQEQREIQELKSRDMEVKAHEQAHAAIGGQYAGAPSYTYQRGPDGQQYAVGGEVPIDISPIAGDPQATIQKMQQVRSAALAPAEPSGADRRIAAEAMQRQMAAQAELVMQSAQAGKTDSASDRSSDAGVAGDVTGASGKETFSYTMNEQDGSAAIVTPQRDTFAAGAEYALRRNVVSSFYARATEPQSRQFSQQA